MALPAGALATVRLPPSFTEQEQIGKRAYGAACATCHGVNGQGQDGVAPPLVHKIYEPGHGVCPRSTEWCSGAPLEVWQHASCRGRNTSRSIEYRGIYTGSSKGKRN